MCRLHSRSFVAALLVAVACSPAGAAAETIDDVRQWHQRLGPPLSGDDFGHYVARAARIQHGASYRVAPQPPGRETLQLDLDTFECVSFIESTLAIARCGWRSDTSEQCFASEVEKSRYRNGELRDYASRLHYFTEWIEDNDRRGRVEDLTTRLGGEPVRREFFHISKRVLPAAALTSEARTELTQAIATTELRLSDKEHAVLTRESAPDVLSGLSDGDLVAFVRERAGLLIHHAGFVYWANGTPRLLHASSYHERVVITQRDVTNYLLRRPERRGVLVVRPLEPR